MKRSRAPSIWHEEAYHAASGCQAASLSLTTRRLHGEKQACQIERQKTGCGFASWHDRLVQRNVQLSGSMRAMELLRLFKDGRLVLLPLEPYREKNSRPDIGKSAYRDTVTFSFVAFALIVGHGPRFRLGTLPCELMQCVAQRLDTGIAPMRFGIVATLVGHRRGSGQCLQAGCILVARAIISDFRQQSRGEPFACTRKLTKQVTVGMGQKKTFNFLIIGPDLFHHR